MTKEKKTQQRLKEKYNKEIVAQMMKDFGFKNINAVPSVQSISINVGIGRIMQKDSHTAEKIIENISIIAGQKPVITKAKKAIAAFKLREGMPVGIKLTLRGEKMYDFLDRLINIALPRIRDFRGLSNKAFDERGNYSIGLKEHTVFPEITPESAEMTHGMQINIVLRGANKETGAALLRHFGFPFKK